MGALKDFKERRFGGFLKWMSARGINIKFDDTIWALAIFGELYDAFKKEEDNALVLRRGLDTMPTAIMEQELKIRKEREAKIAEEADKRDRKIITPKDVADEAKNNIQICK